MLMHIVVISSFLQLYSIPLHGSIAFYLSILLMDILFFSKFVFCYRKYFHSILVHVSWCTWVRTELLGHKACTCLILLGNTKLFSKEVVQLVVWKFSFLHLCDYLVLSDFKIKNKIWDVKWYFTVVIKHVFLIVHLFKKLLGSFWFLFC